MAATQIRKVRAVKLFTLASNGRLDTTFTVREARSASIDIMVGGSFVKRARNRGSPLPVSRAIATAIASVTNVIGVTITVASANNVQETMRCLRMNLGIGRVQSLFRPHPTS